MKLLICVILLTALPVFAAETGCVDNCATGTGTYYFANGDRYEGEWKDGNKDGLGTYYFADGNRAKEEWIEGERASAEICVGTFCLNIPGLMLGPGESPRLHGGIVVFVSITIFVLCVWVVLSFGGGVNGGGNGG